MARGLSVTPGQSDGDIGLGTSEPDERPYPKG